MSVHSMVTYLIAHKTSPIGEPEHIWNTTTHKNVGRYV